MAMLTERHEPYRIMRQPLSVPSFVSSNPSIEHFFGTRHGPYYGLNNGHLGSIKVAEPSYPMSLSVEQVHGTDVLVLDRPLKIGEKFLSGWDAILSNQSGILLTIRTADCVPVLLFDTQKWVIGALHVGWRGAVHGIIPKTLEVIKQHFGCDPQLIQIAIGPSAGSCCYEVDSPVIDLLKLNVPEWPTVFKLIEANRGILDLKELVFQQALRCGVLKKSIHSIKLCTICRSDLFFSYRRDRELHGNMVSGIAIRNI